MELLGLELCLTFGPAELAEDDEPGEHDHCEGSFEAAGYDEPADAVAVRTGFHPRA